jgi:thiol:disulfide interchange protein/DsbC/DsbD-like thiol-disulfide interchange protein
MRRLRTFLALVFCLAAFTARAAHTQASLVLSADTAKPGDTIWAGVDLKMEPGWHTYWKNPGEAGMASKIDWKLPPGVTAGDIQWPLPEKLPPAEVTTYGYNDEVMLLVPLTIGTNVPPGPITLTANLSWLECKDVCIPGKTTVQATLNIGNETKPSANMAAIESWKVKVPIPFSEAQWRVRAWWETEANGDTRSLIIGGYQASSALRAATQAADFFPYASDNFDIQPSTENVPFKNWDFYLRKPVKKFSGDWPTEISGVIVVKQNGQWSGFEVQMPVENEAPTKGTASTPSPSETNTTTSISNPPSPANQTSTGTLLKFLLFAFIGGLILNVMPCVLPVIALKILGFVSEARSEPRRVRNLGFIYALGVLVSFSVLAAIVIGINAAGHRAGWGMQFGNPVFVVCMTTLITLVALNLFGVFEVVPGGRVMDAAGNLASRHGAAGAFFNGLLATILATPCTAPYMATALGFAFSQSAVVIFLILLFVGLGLAAPYVVLSCNPALLKFLPKPGPWMEKFKIAMGFPMLATVVWLLSVAASDFGERVLWLAVFLVVLAFAAWIFGEFVQRGRKGKGLALAIVLVLLICNYAYILEGRLSWRELAPENDATGSLSADGLDWKPWSPQAVADARASGKPVIVDFTATWCVTCNAVVKPALENSSVVDKLKELNATTLLGDYTRTPQRMTDEIAKYGSAGVPLLLVYPKNPNTPAIVLRQPGPLELPSSYSKAVLEALGKASD